MSYNLTSPVVVYFGKETVEAAIGDWFIENGVTHENHRILRNMSTKAPEDFFEMVSAYVENAEVKI